MNERILDKAVQDFIAANLNSDVNKIALSKSKFEGVSSAELANQISAKKKAQKKLPTWFIKENIYYPSSLSIEQTSSESAANGKSHLIVGDSLLDLTGGFGVDSYFFSKKAKIVTHCEINAELSEIAKHNARVLNISNINFLAVDGLTYLAKTDNQFDTIYVDPARRAEKGKVFLLKDCTPDVVSNLDLLLNKCKRLIIKTAPLLDITAGLSELKNVREIHITSIKNECKELLWVLEKDFTGSPKVTASSLNDELKVFTFLLNEIDVDVNYINSLSLDDYLYEPDVALLKSGSFNLIAKTFNLNKLQVQTQLYCSKQIDNNFPGRIFKIERLISATDLKKIKGINANIIVRNYPAKAEDLAKKYKISPSNEDFLIFSKINPADLLIIKAKIIQYY